MPVNNLVLVDENKLNNAMNATADAIREKTGSENDIPWDTDVGFADAILGITTSDGSSVKKTVLFYDSMQESYGPLYAFTADEFLALDEMPELTDVGLINLGWNWNLEDAKEYVQKHGALIVCGIHELPNDLSEFHTHFGHGGALDDRGIGVGRVSGTGDITYGSSGIIALSLTSFPTFYSTLVPSRMVATHINISGLKGIEALGNAVSYSSYYRNGITQVLLNGGVENIGQQAFMSYGALFHVGLPSTLTSINASVFAYCDNLQYIDIPNGLQSIGSYAFASCRTLETIALPSTLTTIDASAFYDCNALTNITLPDGLMNIGSSAFYSCRGLNSIMLPSTLSSIGSMAFGYCSALTSAILADGLSITGKYTFGSCYALRDVTIPSSISVIDDGTFAYCTALKEVKLPSGLTSIGSYAFNNCSNLASINWEDFGSTLSYIGPYAFNYCTRLNVMDGAISLADYSSIYIGSYAFAGCSCIQEVYFPSAMTVINDGVFRFCGLTMLYLVGTQVSMIGINAFAYCTKLYDVSLPSTLTSIGASAFASCYALTKIDIPEACTYIGSSAFEACYALKEIVLNASSVITLASSNAFRYTADDFGIYVPKDLVDTYKSAPNWSYYASKITYSNKSEDR